MPATLNDQAVLDTMASARQPRRVQVAVPGCAEPQTIVKPFPSPVDWRDHWIYFLMTDRFDNPAAPPALPWDRETGDRQGGTFEGVRQQLAYLEELGVGALWLTPVLKNRQSESSHHGYGIMDFMEVDPRFGTAPDLAESELVRLIDEAHARGIYVILDVVINHAGDVFAYDVGGAVWDAAPWHDQPYPIYWRDEDGTARQDWTALPADASRDAGVWPRDLQRNEWFRRQGKGGPELGDFETLKEFKTELPDQYDDRPVWSLLIKAYQYVIARFDVDGFRIDTLKHVERDFALVFCNAIREFASSIGKANFFLFGEIKGGEELLAEYTGRYTSEDEGRTGADAALDFPLQWTLGPASKGFAPPTVVQDVYDLRKRVIQERHHLSTHGEASRFYITFLDNHDDHNRYLYPRTGGDYADQLLLALGAIIGLQGIPCLYYGTEQGLKGTQELYEAGNGSRGGKPEHVREALWGKPNAFDREHSLYRRIRELARVRAAEPALRYGRQYFRQVSGDNHGFGFSALPGGIVAFSRILAYREVLVVANTNTTSQWTGWVLVDARINDDSTPFEVVYSNLGTTGAGTPSSGKVRFYERDGSSHDGWARRLFVQLKPMEIQMLAPRLEHGS
jgi:glycosidase